MPQKVPFSVHAGEPVTINVRGTDGKDYVVRVALAVFEIWDTGQKNPISDVPNFDVRASVAVDVQPQQAGS